MELQAPKSEGQRCHVAWRVALLAAGAGKAEALSQMEAVGSSTAVEQPSWSANCSS